MKRRTRALIERLYLMPSAVLGRASSKTRFKSADSLEPKKLLITWKPSMLHESRVK